ncbi:unnamed protein product [Pseudo-nitzschia multistriata]|uniref:Pyrroloquinoline quinone-dependent pyranose dehydrogenase beta-propeller domain-containing protein n=1 Tax=Pseudo-nitzschia multistriata TaxID=183589 RepID=A0A448ZKU0_9STRA|nr:unnamed protein product [Pseudo-nitzschia multistriata]
MNYNAFPLVNEEVVVSNINEDGMGGAPLGHKTRTLEFDKSGMLYISVGSNKNVDGDSYRSRIRRFNISDPSVTFPQDFQTMEVFADGLRNEVGLAFDKHGILWGVENSADNLVREDLGGDIHEDNVSYVLCLARLSRIFYHAKLLVLIEFIFISNDFDNA